MAKKGEWALLHSVVLSNSERAAQVPDDTHDVPLEMWVKGRLESDANIGENAAVITRTGRRLEGKLLEINPSYTHSFGDFVPEVLDIGDTLRNILFGGDK